MDIKEESLKLHEENKGKFGTYSKVKIENAHDLSLAYTPGVSYACKEIEKDVNNVYKYTSKGNLVAVITDGSAVLGLGNIGPYAGLPVMEGKSILLKELAGIDSFPLYLPNSKRLSKEIFTILLCFNYHHSYNTIKA